MTQEGTMTTTSRRLTATAATLLAATLLAACSDTPTPAPSSTTSTPTYDQTLEGGNDPAYGAGFKQVQSLMTLKGSSSTKLPPDATRFATTKYIAATDKQNTDFAREYDVAKDNTKVSFPEWRGTLLNKNTQRLSWHMELGVCQTVTGKILNSKGQTVAEGPQTRLIRYTLTSADKGKTWLVDETQFVPTETSASKYDPPCKDNMNTSSPTSTPSATK